MNKKYCIIGVGGFGRETLCCLADSLSIDISSLNSYVCFMVDDKYYTQDKIMGVEVIPSSKFDPELYNVVVAVGDPVLRKMVINKLPSNTTFATIIHPSAIISEWVEIGEGSIIAAGSILTCNILIGKHSHINLNTTIGHDCNLGDFFTSAPGVNISGNCICGNCVYFGANSSVREKISICANVTIGMGGVVVKDIIEPGVYVGLPVKKIL